MQHVDEVRQATRETVVVKGSRRGLTIIVDEDAPFERVLEGVRRKLWPARRFFGGVRARLEVGGRLATWDQWMQLLLALKECGLTVHEPDGVPEGEAETTPEPCRAGAGAPVEEKRPRAVVGSARLAIDPSEASWDLGLPASRYGRFAGARTLLVKRTLRSGQRVAFDGNVVVLGDVNPGAEVIASGDIVVVGSLRGMAHAGARGDERAVVVALDLNPLQLRIAHRVARAPEEGSRAERGPELARIRGDAVEVQPYVAGPRGGAE